MAKSVRMLAAKPDEFGLQNPYDGRRELSATSHPRVSILELRHTCKEKIIKNVLINQHIENFRFICG